jgi:organic hydroperoxide reductase OsmC/OhrA
VERRHNYRIVNRWTGNLGTGTSAYTAYGRDYELSGPNKAATISGSSDPAFRGDRGRYNPEELLLGALSACHMLWVLHLCADAHITVTEYMDQARGEMAEHEDGSGEFTRVVLAPHMMIAEQERIDDALAIHQRAHEVCALARSMNFSVEHEPVVNGQGVRTSQNG